MNYIKKANWASVKIISDESVILSMRSSNQLSNIYFNNTNQLIDAIRKRHIYAKNWIISVPDNLCIIKSVDLPATNIDQAYKMLEFELSSYLPIPVEELVYGCVPLNKNDTIIKVKVYILKTKILEEILTQFKTIGIQPTKVMVDSTAIETWFKQDRKEGVNEINLLCGNNIFSIFAVRDGSLIRHEDILLQNNDLKSQKAQIIDEIDRFATEIRVDKEQFILKITAAIDIKPEISSWFDGHYNNIEFLESPKLCAFAGDSNFPGNDFTFESVITEGLVKAAEDPDFIFLNLLPGKVLKKVEQKKLIAKAAITLVLGIFLIFSVWLNYFVINWRVQQACKKITAKITPIEHIASEVESKRQKVNAIQAQMSHRRRISRIFSDLYKYSPKEISISQMNYLTKADVAFVNFNGQAATLPSAFEYSSVMKRSKLLSNIQIINAQQIPKPGGSVVEFKAECLVRGD